MKQDCKAITSIAILITAVIVLSGCTTTSNQTNVISKVSANSDATSFLERDWEAAVPELTNAIKNENYDLVSNFMAPCLALKAPNVDAERRCENYYSQIIVLDVPFTEGLERWLQSEPNNIHANLLESYRLKTIGWTIRGHGVASSVHPRYLGQYQEKLFESAGYALKAIELDPTIPFGYDTAIEAYGSMGRAFIPNRDALVAQALAQVPWSYLVATTRISRSQPRWGGSYEEMEAIAKEHVEYFPVQEGASLDILEAQTLAIRARDWKDGYGVEPNYVMAEASFRVAIDSGYDRGFVLRNLASIYSDAGREEQAENLMLQALAMDPYSESSLSGFMCLCNNLNAEIAISTTERYVERFPIAYEGWLELGILRFTYADDLEGALDAFDQALSLRPYEPDLIRRINIIRNVLGMQLIDTDTIDYQKELLVYAYNNFAHVAAIRSQLKEQLGPQYSGTERQNFDRAVDSYFQPQNFDRYFRQQLDTMDLSYEDWSYIAKLVSIESNISGLTKTEIESHFVELQTSENQALIQAVSQSLGAVGQAMVNQFLQEYESEV